MILGDILDNGVPAIFNRLYAEKNFGEVIMIGWAYVEYIISRLYLENEGLDSAKESDKRKIEYIFSKKKFWKKWNVVKTLDLFDDIQIEAIESFNTDRNNLFHNSLFSYQRYHRERQGLMDSAKKAFDIVLAVYEKKHGLDKILGFKQS